MLNLDHPIFDHPIIEYIRKSFGIGEAPLLPADSRQVTPLTIVIAIMCTLGCLSAFIAMAGFRAADSWTNDLKSAMTIIVEKPHETQDMEKALVITKQAQGVKSAQIMTKDQAKQLLKNYGANIGSLIDELPIPGIIEVSLDGKTTNAAAILDAKFKAEGFNVEIDDHSRYSGEITRASGVVRAAAFLTMLLLTIASVAAIAFAARAALETRRSAVEILHLVGAEDRFVAREVQARFMRLGLLAGSFGAAIAGVVIIISISVLKIGSSELTSTNKLISFWDIWILLIAPLISAIASALAARFAARETLRELI